jgi:hypothetical protein
MCISNDKVILLDGGQLQSGISYGDMKLDGFEYLGKFHDVYAQKSVIRDEIKQELKANFRTMEDKDGDTAEGCYDRGLHYDINNHLDFIDNLFDNKHCDGSDK